MIHLFVFLFMLFSIIFSREIERSDQIYDLMLKEQNGKIDTDFRFSTIKSEKDYFYLKISSVESLIHPSQRYYDNNNIYFSYGQSKKISPNLFLDFSYFIENSKNDPISDETFYVDENFSGFGGGLNKGYLSYQDSIFNFKIGRDNFSLGKNYLNRILFSSNGYPYDQMIFSIKRKNLTLSSFYLSLDNYPIKEITYSIDDTTRHINGARLTIDYKQGYFSINQMLLYGGTNKSMKPQLLNPFIPYYIYQENKELASNFLFSIEWFHRLRGFDFFIEFVLDDFQIDREAPSDLEPTEFALLLNLTKKISSNYFFSMDYLLVANRTFNASNHLHEKFLYKYFPIGHYLGNNFINVDYNLMLFFDKLKINLGYCYIKRGDEALYGEFNKDFLDYSIDQGYSEDFPFGEHKVMDGFSLNIFKEVNKHVLINISASYWLRSYLNNNDLGYGISLVLQK